MTTAALVMAAGRGTRISSATLPKQYLRVGGLAVLTRTLRLFADHDGIDRMAVVIHADDLELCNQATAGLVGSIHVSFGGSTRQQSVRAGLEALAPDPPDRVLIHDAARPFTPAAVIGAVIDRLGSHDGAIAAQAVTDTIKRGDAAGRIIETIPREMLWRAQTPQGFRFGAILDAHRRAAAAGRGDFTDDAGLAEWAGLDVAIVPVEGLNMKITTSEDLAIAETLLAKPSRAMETRIGNGFDVHRFTSGDHVWLGGIRIPHSHGLEGHSDADVALHALTDALLGAIGDGDIGQHFPPSDPQWRGAASHLFLTDAVRRIGHLAGRIVNVDVTLLCEAPRIAPHREAMRARIAGILGIDIARVGVKATTTEGLGFTGRREGMAAMAVASVHLPL